MTAMKKKQVGANEAPALSADLMKVTKKEEADYFKQASDWDKDRIERAEGKTRMAIIGFAVVASLAVIEGVALAGLIPLKEKEPFLVRVDSSTGIVDQVVRLKDAKVTYDEVMTKFFLRRVVTLRETYTRSQLQTNYDQSMLFTAPSARPQLKAAYSFDNPNGPYKRYGETGIGTVQIVNVSFVSKNVAQVRYVRTDRKSGAESTTRWVATVEFRYVAAPAGEDARGVNPLGFQVTNYRNDPEAVVEEAKS
jgi:type IV secretion system protein VirB8